MKKLRGTILVAGIVAGMFVPTTALGDSFYCNQRGECVVADRQGRTIILKLRSPLVDSQYQLCLEAGAVRCTTFTTRRLADGTYYHAARVGRDLPIEGRGRYRVRWRQGDRTIGTLLFRIR